MKLAIQKYTPQEQDASDLGFAHGSQRGHLYDPSWKYDQGMNAAYYDGFKLGRERKS